MKLQRIVIATPQEIFPAADVILRKYKGALLGVKYEGMVDVVTQRPDGMIIVQDLARDSGFWFDRHEAVWFNNDNHALEIHIMRVGIMEIFDVSST